MNWYVERFRERVDNGHYAQQSGRVALTHTLIFEKYGSGGPRPNRLTSPDFTGQRLWVARQVGVTVADREVGLSVISTVNDDEHLYMQLEFGANSDNGPLVRRHKKLHGPLPDEPHDQLLQAHMWSKDPAHNPQLHQHIVLPPQVLEGIDMELRRTASYPTAS